MGDVIDVDSEAAYMDLKGDVGSAPAGLHLARETPLSQGLPGRIPHHPAANGSAEDIVQLHTQLGQHIPVTDGGFRYMKAAASAALQMKTFAGAFSLGQQQAWLAQS